MHPSSPSSTTFTSVGDSVRAFASSSVSAFRSAGITRLALERLYYARCPISAIFWQKWEFHLRRYRSRRRRRLLIKLRNGLGHLRALRHPEIHAIFLHIDGGWVRAGIVDANDFQIAAITGAILFDDNDTVDGLFARAT